MKKQSIVLGSIFVVGLLLLVPNISAVEYQTIGDTDWSKDELRAAILERIEELQSQEKNPTLEGLSWEDPDGPYEGGLDDYNDWIHLVVSVLLSLELLLLYKIDKPFTNIKEDLLSFLQVMVVSSWATIVILLGLGDALDVIDTDLDEC